MSKKNFIMFILGASIGSVVTWKYTEQKYEQIAQDEIDSVKETFSKREKHSVIEYAARLREQGYTNYSEEVKQEPMIVDKAPYVIAPEEFGDLDDYKTISLTYYADQILADDNDQLVEDIQDVVGFESLNSFGEYEDDSVFVRNDRLKCDYEILLDKRKYSNVIRRKPVND